MPHAVKYNYISFADYLDGERDGEVRHEYVDGYIYAMSGASELHNAVNAELVASIFRICQTTANWDAATLGDATNVILCAAGQNIRKLLRWLYFVWLLLMLGIALRLESAINDDELTNGLHLQPTT